MGNNLQLLRVEKGISITDLAQKTSVSVSYISKIERGVFPLTSTLIRRLCSVLGCTEEIIKEEFTSNKYDFQEQDVTFKGNQLLSIHRWYPYIEGFSASFVKSILDRYPHDSVIYDPFNGSGTTMITAAYSGYRVLASEINPFMQFIAQTKVNTVKNIIESKTKQAILGGILREFDGYLDDNYPKVEVSQYINGCYINEDFFEEDALSKIAFIKSFASKQTDDIKNIILIALASIIVEISKMIRAADLRRRTNSEQNDGAKYAISLFKKKFKNIVDDINSMVGTRISYAPIISNNAKEFNPQYSNVVDAIITSPPYINGTNYFRNTKLELWILDFISSKDDLRKYRSKAITAGINNVSKDIDDVQSFPFVEAYVEKLDKISPDKRIPKMIRAYFSDINIVFSNFEKMLKDDGKIYFDIGDSEYYGVHIPVDELVEHIAKQNGLDIDESLVTRNRKSKRGTILTQKLLVFKKQSRNRVINDIKNFGSIFPYKTGEYTKRNWGSGLHSLCSYQGKLKPSIAYHLITRFTKSGQTVLDPFCGIGTIPLEACLNGRIGIGIDINPIAYANTFSKVRILDQQRIQNELTEFHRFLNNYNDSELDLSEASRKLPINNGTISEYYHPKTLKEILIARKYFSKIDVSCPEQQFLLSCMLHILHGNRPYALSKRSNNQTPLKPRPDEVAEYKNVADKLQEKAERMYPYLRYSNNFSEGNAIWNSIFDVHLNENSVDAIITSPPFASSTRFYSSNWLRLWFCGWENSDFTSKKTQFVDYKQERAFSDTYREILNKFYTVIKPRGLIILHLGKTNKVNMGQQIYSLLTNDERFEFLDLVEENVTHCDKHGLKDQGATTDHQFLFFIKK